MTCPAFKAGDPDGVGMVGSTPTRFRQALPVGSNFRSTVLLIHVASKKRKCKKYDPATEARRRAREQTGQPPRERVLPDKRRKPPKHKKKVFDDELL